MTILGTAPPSTSEKIKQWRAQLQGKFEAGGGLDLDHALLKVRSRGCSLSIGESCSISSRIILERSHSHISIGSRTQIEGNTVLSIASSLEIGDDVLISFDVVVMDHDSHSQVFAERQTDVVDGLTGNEKRWQHVAVSPIAINNKAWVGARCIILKGVCIGEGAIVGAGSVVTRSVPAWTVVAGNPAKVLKKIDRAG